jgi:methylenetetrahydrofolate dehydrogenase (NADP+)/methenyltetrahydrofolate cyclohydrolase
MPALIIDGKAVSDRRRTALAAKVHTLSARGTTPCLAAITVAADHGWTVYLRNQAAACAAVGIRHKIISLPANAGQDDLSAVIEELNLDAEVHGIILQSPLPKPFNDLQAQARLSPDKDVEGVNPANLGLLLAGRPALAPCTALSAVALAQEGFRLIGKGGDDALHGVEAVVVGASTIVGKPIAQLLILLGATVTTCHIQTRDLKSHTAQADLVVVAVGRAGLITPAHVRAGAVVVDVGINRATGADGKAITVGDVAPAVIDVAAALTPVPGGVGALTTTILLESTAAAAERLAESATAYDPELLARLVGGSGINLPPGAAERIATLLSRHLVAVPGTAAPRSALARRIASGVFVMDGAMGTALIARGIAPGATARANVDHPDLVLAAHRDFVAAGAEALTANTFGANRWRLSSGKEGGGREEAMRLATAGVQLARQAARSRAQSPGSTGVFVFGSLGPSGRSLGADLAPEDAESGYAEVALAMADAGADAILIETMPSTAEATCALAAVRRVTRLPALVCRSIDRIDQGDLVEFARAMEAGGATAIGVNCAAGPRAVAEVAAALARLTRLPVIARPNAGFPTRENGRLVYHLRPDYLLTRLRECVQAGVGILGGCCGVGPEHIAVLAGALAGTPLPPRGAVDAAAPASSDDGGLSLRPSASGRMTANATTEVLHPFVQGLAGDFPIIALLPGRLDPAAAAAAAKRLAAAGAGTVGLLGGWPGAARGARLAARSRHLADAAGVPALLELIAGDTTLAAAQDAALQAHLLGLRLIMIDAGVFSGAARADADAGGADAVALVRAIKRLNAGRDLGGGRLDQATAFAVGVRVGAKDAARAGEFAAAGADFLALAPIYSPPRFRAAITDAGTALPILAEVLLLPDAATADELDNELPALSVPERLKQRLRDHPDEDVRGVLAFLAGWRGRLAGVCVLAADERTAQAETVIRAIVAGHGNAAGAGAAGM